MQSSRDQHAALQYIDHHVNRLPVVMLARIGREWDLYKPVQMAHLETGEGRPFAASLAGLAFYYALLPFAVGGIVIMRRRRIDQWFLLVPAGVVTLVSALSVRTDVLPLPPLRCASSSWPPPPWCLLSQRFSGESSD